MKTRLFGILCILIATLTAQSRVLYVNGPSFQVPGDYFPHMIDFNGDGRADCSFGAYGPICTMDVPSSLCDWLFNASAAQTSELLVSGSSVSLQSLGGVVGSDAPPGSNWGSPGQGGVLMDWFWSERFGTSGQSGPVAALGVGYLGLQFNADDGSHFGWVRVRLPLNTTGTNGFPLELVPVVVDWAFETQTNTPIRAGNIGADGDSLQFKVEFFENGQKRDGAHHLSGSGSVILTEGKLCCELHLSGNYPNAEIQGPANPHSHGKAKPVWIFGPPLVQGTNHTAFFGEAQLSRDQLRQFARGQLYFSIGNGTVIGRISPLGDDRRRKR